jgi:hypothetical protein
MTMTIIIIIIINYNIFVIARNNNLFFVGYPEAWAQQFNPRTKLYSVDGFL